MQIPKVNKDEAVLLHDQVAAEIRRAIAEGEAKPGERLPRLSTSPQCSG
jgi:GntR family transcriptional regulator